MFDHNGVPSTVKDWVAMIRKIAPDAKITIEGNALPFPAELSDDPIRDYLGEFGHLSLGEGIQSTFETFQTMLRNDVISPDLIR